MTGKQLKNSILQWAIQGKLVPQDPNDEPASVLLEKIRQEKERLFKEKKLKRDKNASFIFRGEDNSYYEKFLATGEVKCIDEEIPFEIPQGWEWCRLSCLTSILGDGIHGTPEYDNAGDIYFVNGNNLNDGIITIKNDTKRVNSTEAAKHKRTLTESTVLVSINGTIGKVAFYNNEKIILGKSACYFNLLGCINKVYVKCIIETEYFSEYAKKVATGTTIKNVPLAGMKNFLIPLPSLSEQSRIVHRINELKTKVSRYNHLQSELDISNRSIFDKLKKSALQEAVQGRLVPQIAEEGTARELLEQIRQEKQKLVEEDKLKKTALTDSIIYKGEDNRYYEKIDQQCKDITEEIPFEIPENWEWARLSSIVRMTIGKTPPRGEQSYWNNGIYPWVSISDMYEGGITSETKEKVSEYAANNLFSAISPKGSLLMSFKLTVGRTTILGIDAYHNEAIITIFPYLSNDNIMKMYLFKLLPILSTNGDSKDAIKGKTLNSKSLANLLIPLPPLQEQQRIVAQIERLFEQLK